MGDFLKYGHLTATLPIYAYGRTNLNKFCLLPGGDGEYSVFFFVFGGSVTIGGCSRLAERV